MLAILLAGTAILIIAGFAWMASLTRDLGRMVKTVAGQVSQETEKPRATLPARDR